MKEIGIDVNTLLKYLQKEVAAGHGDYKIFVTDDEEANGYHAIWYLGQTAEEMAEESKENLEYVEKSNHDIMILEKDTNKAIYIG